jgi:hypothetical protein
MTIAQTSGTISGPEKALSEPSVAPLRYLVAATITGIAGAAWLVESAPGIGVPLVACLAALALLLGGGLELRGWTIVFGAFGVALVSTAALRAAEWIVFPNLVFAIFLAAFAMKPPATWSEVLSSLMGPPVRMFTSPAYLLRSAAALVRGAKPSTLAPLIRGLLMGGTLVAVFWALFASADRAFLEFSNRLIPDWDLGLLPFRVIFFVFTIVATTAFLLSGLHSLPKYLQNVIDLIRVGGGWKPRRTEWMTALSLLNLLFLAFVTVQILVLFAGHDHILRTADLSYAEYARQGFVQLLFSATLTAAVVAAAWNLAEHKHGIDLALLRLLLGILCLLTFVILVSALRRLGLYEEAFGFTRLRLSAHAFGLWLGGVFVLLLVAGATLRTKWLARGTIVFTACALLAFSALDPDTMIARRNLGRYRETGKIDLPYLTGLSADAVPELAKMDPSLRSRALAGFQQQLSTDEPWSSFNLGRERARSMLGID